MRLFPAGSNEAFFQPDPMSLFPAGSNEAFPDPSLIGSKRLLKAETEVENVARVTVRPNGHNCFNMSYAED